MQGAGSHFQLESPTVSSCATEGVTLARQRNTTVMNAAQAGRISRRQRQRRKGKPETSRVSNPQEPAGPRRFAGPCCCCCCCNSTRFAASGTEPAAGPCGRPGEMRRKVQYPVLDSTVPVLAKRLQGVGWLSPCRRPHRFAATGIRWAGRSWPAWQWLCPAHLTYG